MFDIFDMFDKPEMDFNDDGFSDISRLQFNSCFYNCKLKVEIMSDTALKLQKKSFRVNIIERLFMGF